MSATIAFLPIAPVILGITKARALTDTTPITIVNITTSTSAVNVNSGPVQVNLSGTVTDDLSGFAYTKFYYSSPSLTQVFEGEMTAFSSTSFEAKIIFPQYGESGVWTPTMTFSDASGNVSDYTSSELAALGLNLNVTVTSDTPDTEVMQMTSLLSDRVTVDTFNTSDQNLLTATITDNLSGFSSGSVKYTAPSGQNTVTAPFTPGFSANQYVATTLFLPFIETGTWALTVTIIDAAGNTKVFDSNDLAIAGMPSSIQVTGEQDTTPITINSLGFVPADDIFYTVPVGGAVFKLKGTISDNLSGIAIANVIYRSQTTSQVAYYNATYDGSDPNTSDWFFYVQTPPYAAEGLWLPEVYTLDAAGTQHTYTHAELVALGYDLSITIGQNITENVTNGGSITTDTGGTGATITTPVQSSVTTPNGGDVSITRLDAADPNIDFGGYTFFAEQFNINAPAATAETPLVLTFDVDQSKLGGLTANDVEVFRDGIVIDDCLVSTIANPDPCVVSRVTLPGGDVRITVNTIHASIWMLGVSTSNPAQYQFQGFKKPLKAAPQLNKEEAGETLPIKFSLGGNFGTNVLTTAPTTQQINCNTREPIGDTIEAVSVKDKGLQLKENGFYRFNWKTLKKWKNSCRKFTLSFTNGEVISIYFRFKHDN